MHRNDAPDDTFQSHVYRRRNRSLLRDKYAWLSWKYQHVCAVQRDFSIRDTDRPTWTAVRLLYRPGPDGSGEYARGTCDKSGRCRNLRAAILRVRTGHCEVIGMQE